MRLRNLVAAITTTVVTLVVTNAVKSRQAERDLWAQATDTVD